MTLLDALVHTFRPVRYSEPVVALDLETSGLDPRSDRILAIAAIPVEGTRVVLHQRFEQLICDTGPVNPEAIRHHRLRPQDVAEGATLADAMYGLQAWLKDRPIVGYATAFDLAFLRRAAAPLGINLPKRHADVRELMHQRQRRGSPESAQHLRFEQIAAELDTPIVGRHSALGDALSTALMWIALGVRAEGWAKSRAEG